MGFALRPDVWGRGYGVEMVRLLVGVGFNDLKLHRIRGALPLSARLPPRP